MHPTPQQPQASAFGTLMGLFGSMQLGGAGDSANNNNYNGMADSHEIVKVPRAQSRGANTASASGGSIPDSPLIDAK